MVFRSDGLSEKKAISDAEAKPDKIKSKPANIIDIRAGTEGVFTIIPSDIDAIWYINESESKGFCFSLT